jgi:hypothetical protein
VGKFINSLSPDDGDSTFLGNMASSSHLHIMPTAELTLIASKEFNQLKSQMLRGTRDCGPWSVVSKVESGTHTHTDTQTDRHMV